MRVYLADLGYDQLTISSDVFPLGVANLATYALARVRNSNSLEIRLFREPAKLKAAIDSEPPDVLGLSSYAWNHNLSVQVSEYAKSLHPSLLTIMGGPNFPLTEVEQESFLRTMPSIDAWVRGQTYEGERAFCNVIERYLDVDQRLDALLSEPIAGNVWIDPQSGDFVDSPPVERIHDLDEIPSPYLSGWLEPFFKTSLFPLLQIARGCPFSCTFCNSSVESNNKIYAHSTQNVKDDLHYIAQRVSKETPLCFADDNFGMYTRDEEIVDYIAYLQDKYGWPTYIRTTTGKNRGERIIRVMRKVRGAMPMTSAVQSLDAVVLQNIRRSNISLDTYAKIQQEVHDQGMQSYGELILCLPGETPATFMKAIESLLDTGVRRVSAHQLMLLHGAPLSNPDSRERYEFDTRFRVVARNIGKYFEEPSIEVEEVVVSTPTISFHDYMEIRVFHLLLTIFYYEDNFQEVFELAKQAGIKPFDIVVRLQAGLSRAPQEFRKVVEDFVEESNSELFESPEACLAWGRWHYQELVDGTVGGNLLSKYSMLGRFYCTQEGLSFISDIIAAALTERGDTERLEQLQDVVAYLRNVLLHVPFSQTLEASVHWESMYDVEQWRRDDFTRPLETHRLQEPRTYVAAVEPKVKRVLKSRVAAFGEHPSGLGKFTRTVFAHELRRAVGVLADEGDLLDVASATDGSGVEDSSVPLA